MKTNKPGHVNLERALKDVYRKNGRSNFASIDPQWKTNVLRQIRTLQKEVREQTSPIDLFQQAVWRLAPVAGGLALIMAMWIYKGGLSPELDIAALAMNNPDQFSMFQLFGM